MDSGIPRVSFGGGPDITGCGGGGGGRDGKIISLGELAGYTSGDNRCAPRPSSFFFLLIQGWGSGADLCGVTFCREFANSGICEMCGGGWSVG